MSGGWLHITGVRVLPFPKLAPTVRSAKCRCMRDNPHGLLQRGYDLIAEIAEDAA